MRKNNFGKRFGVLLFSATIAVASAMPAFAAGTNYGTEIGGTKTTTFDKYLVMDKEANVPNASFTYAVTAGEAMTYDLDGKTFEIFAGVDADKVTMAGVGSSSANTIAYAQGDTTLNDENALVKNYDKDTEKYAKKTGTLDFSACAFTEPGVYRYILTESGTNLGVTNDADLTRVIDVYVNDDSTANAKKLTIAGYVLSSNANDAPTIPMGDDAGTTGSYNPAETKSQGFTNEYDTVDLTVRKEVTGNQASRDKYFKFTVAISGAVAGTVYDVIIDDADPTTPSNDETNPTYVGKTNPTTITVGQDGTVSTDFYLQHNQQVVVQGLANGTSYTVTEDPENYKSTANTAATAVVTNGNANTNGVVASDDLVTGYQNKKDGIVSTAVYNAVKPFLPFVGIGLAGILLIVVCAVIKKKRIA